MNKFFLSLLLIFSSFVGFAQNDTTFNSLYKKFSDLYYSIGKNENYFDRLSKTSGIFFTSQDTLLINEISSLKREKKKSFEAITLEIYDSLIDKFSREAMESEYDPLIRRYNDILNIYNQKFCKCAASVAADTVSHRFQMKDFEKCITAILTDTGYVSYAKKIFNGITMTEAQSIGNASSVYLFLNCNVLYTKVKEVIWHSSVYSLLDERAQYFNSTNDNICQLYNKDKSELKRIFPGYKKFVGDIDSIDKLNKSSSIYTNIKEPVLNENGSTSVEIIYYTNEGALKIKGLLNIIFEKDNFFPKVLTFTFTSSSKIKDSKKLLDNLDIKIPPPGNN